MSDYNSGFTGDKVVELLNMIPDLAKADLSNAMTVSLGQNGYAKFNNGFLIQWGRHAGSSTTPLTIYLSISFYDANYTVIGNVMKSNVDNNVYTFNPLPITSKNSFRVDRSYYTQGGSGTSTGAFCWFAIGRWK